MPCTLGTRAFRTFTIKLLPRRAASYATYTDHCAVAAIHALAARGLAKEAKRARDYRKREVRVLALQYRRAALSIRVRALDIFDTALPFLAHMGLGLCPAVPSLARAHPATLVLTTWKLLGEGVWIRGCSSEGCVPWLQTRAHKKALLPRPLPQWEEDVQDFPPSVLVFEGPVKHHKRRLVRVLLNLHRLPRRR
jgi:hypothetical protein